MSVFNKCSRKRNYHFNLEHIKANSESLDLSRFAG
jgi:hypothetical protein